MDELIENIETLVVDEDELYLSEKPIKRLCLQAGIKNVKKECYNYIKRLLNELMKDVLNKILILMDYRERKIVKEEDIKMAFKITGFNIYDSDLGKISKLKILKRVLNKITPYRKSEYYRKQDCVLFFPKIWFSKEIHDMSLGVGEIKGWANNSKDYFQFIVERIIFEILMGSAMIMNHCGRNTLFPKDITLFRNLKIL